MRFEFATAKKIIFGPGAIKDLGSILKGFGRCALLVTGKNADRAEPVIKLLKDQAIAARLFPVPGEPDVGKVEQGVTQAKAAGCDLVISFGGGSAIDAGKAIAAMLANPGQLLDYLEVIGRGKTLAAPSAPFIAIPTTAGTGSEVTRNAVLASPAHRVKVSLRSPLMLARIALVDPELTHDLPPSVTASTGLDALTQLIEPYVCSRPNPMTDSICIEGMRRAARSLRIAFEHGHNAAAREDMALASLFGGLALANAGLGAVHGFAGPIGGMFPAPHGAVCAALLPQVIDVNVRALHDRYPGSETLTRYDQVARVITANPAATSADAVTCVRELVAALGVPSLKTYGITASDIGAIVDQSAKASSMKANPIALTPAEMAEVLARAI